MAEGESLRKKKFWHETFNEKFQDFLPDVWELSPTDRQMSDKGWQTFQDKAKVKFVCSHCGRSWTSMRGLVIFWYQLHPEKKKGLLRFKLFRQKCERHTKDFQDSIWYREEIDKVLSNVHQKIGEKYYNFRKSKEDVSKRNGVPKAAHNKSMCEACQMGVCKYNRTNRKR